MCPEYIDRVALDWNLTRTVWIGNGKSDLGLRLGLGLGITHFFTQESEVRASARDALVVSYSVGAVTATPMFPMVSCTAGPSTCEPTRHNHMHERRPFRKRAPQVVQHGCSSLLNGPQQNHLMSQPFTLPTDAHVTPLQPMRTMLLVGLPTTTL